MDRRIYGLENEYGVTCTLRGQRRLSPDEVARYLFRRVVSWGRSSNVFLANGARLYLDVGSHPEYATPECDSLAGLVAHDKAGERILEQLLESAEQRLAEEGIRATSTCSATTPTRPATAGCHENYLTSRHDDLTLHRSPDPVPGEPPDLRGAAVLQTAAAPGSPWRSVEHIWEASVATRSADHQHRDEPRTPAVLALHDRRRLNMNGTPPT